MWEWPFSTWIDYPVVSCCGSIDVTIYCMAVITAVWVLSEYLVCILNCCVGCIYFIATHIHFSVSFDMAIIYLNLILRLTLTKYLVTLTKKYSHDSRNHVRWRSTQHLNNIHTLQVQCSSLHAALHQLTAYLALCVVCCGCIACTICTTLCISVWYIL